MGKSAFFRLIALVALIGLSACASRPPPTIETEQTRGGALVESFQIGVDDTLQISVWRNPELSVSVPVRPDGKISVPLIGDVQAGGLTPQELSQNIRQKLSAFVREPIVTVIVTSVRSAEFLNRVRLTGAVRAPRSLPHRRGMTVLDAVLEVGGVNDFAAPNRTKLYRKVGGKVEVYDIKLGDILTEGELGTNALLQPGDVLVVPERLF